MKSKPIHHDDPEQSKRFTDAARKLGEDETGEAFERAFHKIASGPIPPFEKPTPKPRKPKHI